MIPVNGPNLSGLEEQYVLDAVRSGWITTGRYVTEFEARFAEFCGQREAVTCTSGTMALLLALVALELPRGSRVAIPAYTCNSVLNAVLWAGHVPVVVDVDTSWGLSESVAVVRPDAVILAHTYGVPAAATRTIESWCRAQRPKRVWLIEDGSEAHGAEVWNGKTCRPVGSFGDVSIFSCRGEKLIGAGHMGVCVTSHPGLATRLRYYRDGGRPAPALRYWSTAPGLNLMISNVTAALAVAQLERVQELVQAKRRVHGWYRARLRDVPGLTFQPVMDGDQAVWWLTAIRYGPDYSRLDPRDLSFGMTQAGVEARPPFYPLDWLIREESMVVSSFAEALFRSVVILPSGGTLTEAEVDRVVTTLHYIAGHGSSSLR